MAEELAEFPVLQRFPAQRRQDARHPVVRVLAQAAEVAKVEVHPVQALQVAELPALVLPVEVLTQEEQLVDAAAYLAAVKPLVARQALVLLQASLELQQEPQVAEPRVREQALPPPVPQAQPEPRASR